ncbi:MAG: ABC transporter permease, partial [Acinetobacter sp.]
MNKSVMPNWQYHSYGLIGLISCFGLWLFAGMYIPEGFFQQFTLNATLLKFLVLIQDSETYVHIWMSIQRVLVGLGIALVIGIPVGLLIGQNQKADALTSQIFQFLRMISPLSWM